MAKKAKEAYERKAYWSSTKMKVWTATEQGEIIWDAEATDEATFIKYFRVGGKKQGKLLDWVVIHDIIPTIDIRFE